ncbi:MAG TPA: GDP-L-fucose synthase, partial [Vicinamibacterales bacterium]|nr:GDP-L-fucose synthase [Vicinamibacterales bacterium]
YDDDAPINLGRGETTSIAELAELICEVMGYRGRLEFDASKPDGVPLKGLDSSRLHELGWKPSVALREGIEKTVEWYRSKR